MADENKALETVREEVTGVAQELKTLIEQQDAEMKKYGETTEETAKAIKQHSEKIDALENEKKELEQRLEKMELEAQKPRYNGGGDSEVKLTPGMQFVTSEEFKSATAKRATTDYVGVKSLFEMKQVVGDDTPDTPVRPDRVPEIFFDPGQRTLRIMDIMNTATTTSNTVEFVQETTFDPDNAAAQNGEGSAKSEGDMAFDLKTASVVTIAHWLPVSRQALDDAAMLQSHIDNRLTYSVMKTLEDEILFGDGTSGSMTGIHNTDGVDTIGAPAGDDTMVDHIRKALRDVRLSEYAPTGIILNPSDWAEIELLKGDDEHYIWVTVPNGGEMRLWRVPVIETTAMEEGRFLTGAFGLGAQLWDRQQAQIRVSESHSDYFTKNLVAILAEVRMALTVYRPGAFIKGTLNDEIAT